MNEIRPFLFRCTNCGTKNKIPADKVGKTGKCGKCGSPMETGLLLSGEPVMVTDANFDNEVLKSPLPVLAFAWAPW